jgi:transposase InsO family protein
MHFGTPKSGFSSIKTERHTDEPPIFIYDFAGVSGFAHLDSMKRLSARHPPPVPERIANSRLQLQQLPANAGQDRALASYAQEPHLAYYYLPGDLEAKIDAFVDHYNHRRYHESLSNLIPADVYFGRAQTILLERERIKRDTIRNRRLQHQKNAA